MTNGDPASRHVVISGCSGGGKSTLLAELARRGHAVVDEPGRRIVEEELRGGGGALPWIDMAAFAKRAVEVAVRDREAAPKDGGWIFFDRGLIDAAVALRHATGQALSTTLSPIRPYHARVFLTPPWPEIYAVDQERRHGLDEAVAEYDRLLTAYGGLGYDWILLPRAPLGERADFILRHLSQSDYPKG